jgi:hypothetical protein
MKLIKLVMVAAILAVPLGISSSAGAQPLNLFNLAVAETFQFHQDQSQLAWGQAETNFPVVPAYNRAQAQSWYCQGCNAEAVAFQVVLASNMSRLNATNLAVSTNNHCETCTATSVAEQWVVGATSGTVVLSQAGQTALQAVKAQLATLVQEPPSEGLAGILGAADEVSAILAADVSVVPSPATVPAAPAAAVSPLAQPASSSSPTIQHFAQVST